MRRVGTVLNTDIDVGSDSSSNPLNQEMTMNAKAILFVAAIAASANVFAAGRDSVYAQPGVSIKSSSFSKATTVATNGRSSVYAKDLPAPTRTTRHAVITEKFGRA